jgi:hypothetical protein
VQRRVLDLVAKAARPPAGAGRYGAKGRLATDTVAARSFKTKV